MRREVHGAGGAVAAADALEAEVAAFARAAPRIG
jgi:hypothetical protein